MTHITNLPLFKQQALHWANQFDICTILDSNHISDKYQNYDFIIAAGYSKKIECNFKNAFEKLKVFKANTKNWIIGGFGYDLKNDIENLNSSNPDKLHFPDLFFYEPLHLICIKNNEIEILSTDKSVINQIKSITIPKENEALKTIKISSSFTKEEYINTVKKIQQEIVNGNIYETNFCVEFFSENQSINPLKIYQNLNTISPTPFSSFFKWFDKYILCASPERFITKKDNKLISQPIKGTAKRGNSLEEDELLKQQLLENPKEKQENVMIVDLVRNDLTKSAAPASVKVEELCGIYSFQQVHQMISTVVCNIKKDLNEIDAIKNTFPMGSMTGAPKIKAMKLMEQFEKSKRGIYSGAIGYISSNNDFDFNVIIRSILYNSSNNYLSFHAGSAITYYANAEKEYEECLLKISAMLKALNAII